MGNDKSNRVNYDRVLNVVLIMSLIFLIVGITRPAKPEKSSKPSNAQYSVLQLQPMILNEFPSYEQVVLNKTTDTNSLELENTQSRVQTEPTNLNQSNVTDQKQIQTSGIKNQLSFIESLKKRNIYQQ